jgi:hypothetical protein
MLHLLLRGNIASDSKLLEMVTLWVNNLMKNYKRFGKVWHAWFTLTSVGSSKLTHCLRRAGN